MNLEDEPAAGTQRAARVHEDRLRLRWLKRIEFSGRHEHAIEARREFGITHVLRSVLAAQAVLFGLNPRVRNRCAREVDPDVVATNR